MRLDAMRLQVRRTGNAAKHLIDELLDTLSEEAAAEAAKLAEGEALFKAFVLAGGVQNHTVKADTRHGKLVMVLKYLKYKEVTGQNIPRKLGELCS